MNRVNLTLFAKKVVETRSNIFGSFQEFPNFKFCEASFFILYYYTQPNDRISVAHFKKTVKATKLGKIYLDLKKNEPICSHFRI